jgi:N-ethylmaleimide reductase
MAPMTRSRAINNIPNDIMANYYGMLADVGLIITEGTVPSANGLGLAYLHIVEMASMGRHEVSLSLKLKIVDIFGVLIIHRCGLNKETAEAALTNNEAALVAFGRPMIANLGLDYRMENDLPLQDSDFDTFYTPGEKGYTEYPFAVVNIN